jgi:hypothetical protein
MIDHVWTVVCSWAVVDRRSNNASLENVVEQVTISDTPRPGGILALQFDVMTLWARADFDVPTSGHGHLVLLSPSGEELKSSEYDIELRRKAKRYRSVVHFDALPVGEPGRYVFRAELWNADKAEWDRMADVPLEVVFEPPETTQETD